MKKQNLSLSLALALTLFTYLAGTPYTAYAGPQVISGGSEDSPSSSGDTFRPIQPIRPLPGTNVQIRDKFLNLSEQTRNNLNEAARNLLSQIAANNTLAPIAASVLRDGANSEEAANQLYACILSAGASPSSVESLVGSLWGLGRTKSDGSAPGQEEQLNIVSSTECSSGYTVFVDQVNNPDIDINKLNTTINIFNKIVIDSNSEALQKLSKDPQFVGIGNLLRQLRATLSPK
ncbi:hypothetical protein [Nodularia sp. UHCC 0506]|uniref:hypothetical protein n=1 Tax=Nodularia sp. UHCC 0506 TaxID=3110243 RepID=UPI002B20A928|nr:hypothetical protein [Nodularia sp. UHCC 0506]MEA5516169.1 hypothetical protein [Nodularia sp. UHCC 0506]